MKKIYLKYLVFLLTILSPFIGKGQVLPNPLNLNGVVAEYDGGTTASINLAGGSDVKIKQSVVTQSVSIEVGSTLFIVGDLDIITNGGAKLKVNGTLIVTGSLNIQSNGNSEDNTIEATGVLVVGGSYDIGGNKETNEGTVFLSDPDSDGDGLVGDGGDLGNLGDLLEADPPVLPDDVLEDIVENIDDPTLIPAITWEGNTSAVWTEPSNWLDNKLPTDYSRVVIDKVNGGFDAMITSAMGEVRLASLTLASGKLVISEGARVTFLNDFTTNGNLTVLSSNALPASVICKGTVTGDMTFQCTYNNDHWYFIGHPISNPSIDDYHAIRTDLSNPDNDYLLYDYKDDFTFFKVSDITSGDTYLTDQSNLRGYQLKVLNPNTVVTYTGAVNNNELYQKAAVAEGGWQIIANPYPAYYQLPVGSADFDGTEKTVYVSDSKTNATKQFLTFNTEIGMETPENTLVDGIIAPGQAFYIKTATGGAGNTINMRKSNLVHTTGVQLKSAVKQQEKNVLRIKLANEYNLADEAVIALLPDGEVGITNRDSKQRMYDGTDYSFIYSMVDNEKVVINSLPTALGDFQQPLGIKTKAGKQVLSIKGTNSLTGNYELILEDRATKPSTMTTLNNTTKYEFTTDGGDEQNRFILHFKALKEGVSTGVVNVDEQIEQVNVYLQNSSTLCVNCKWKANQKIVKVYTVTGALVMHEAFTGERFTRELEVQPGLYIVRVDGENKAFEQKVLIK